MENENINAILEKEVSFTFAKSSGPGGQNVNKVNSKANLAWPFFHSVVWNDDFDAMNRFVKLFKNKINKKGEVIISSQTERDQPSNKLECMTKLKSMIEEALIVPKERNFVLPVGNQERRIADKMAEKRRKEFRNYWPEYD